MDLDILQLANDAVPIAFFVFGLVAFCKSLGLTGRVLTVVSMVLGLLFGLAYRISIAVPVTLGDWFLALLFGLFIGLAASGTYDQITRWIDFNRVQLFVGSNVTEEDEQKKSSYPPGDDGS